MRLTGRSKGPREYEQEQYESAEQPQAPTPFFRWPDVDHLIVMQRDWNHSRANSIRLIRMSDKLDFVAEVKAELNAVAGAWW